MGSWLSFYRAPGPPSQSENSTTTPREASSPTVSAQNGAVVNTPQFSGVSAGRDICVTSTVNTHAYQYATNPRGSHVTSTDSGRKLKAFDSLVSQQVDNPSSGATVPEDLSKTMEDLKNEDFKAFKWYLQQPGILEGYQPIKVNKLEKGWTQ